MTDGTIPSSSSTVTPTATNTASTDSLPSLVQYTSRRCRMSANSSRTRAAPSPKSAAAPARQFSEPPGVTIGVTPPMSMNTTPNTMWCTCRSPGVTLPGHQRTWARISRTESRIKPNPATNAQKKQNSGNRPFCTMFVLNQLECCPHQPGRRRKRALHSSQARRSYTLLSACSPGTQGKRVPRGPPGRPRGTFEQSRGPADGGPGSAHRVGGGTG